MAINPDRISAAQAKLAEDPHDVDSWVLLIKHCQCRSVGKGRLALAADLHGARRNALSKHTYENIWAKLLGGGGGGSPPFVNFPIFLRERASLM